MARNGRGEDEPRGWDYLLGAFWQHGFGGLAKTFHLGMMLNLDPVNIKLDTLLDRWYNHLLVFILVFCPYLFYHSLLISRSAQPRASSIISTYTRFNLRLS